MEKNKFDKIVEKIKRKASFFSTASVIELVDELQDDYLDLLIEELEPIDQIFLNEKIIQLSDCQKELGLCLMEKEELCAQLNESVQDKKRRVILNNKKIGIIGGHPKTVFKIKGFLEKRFSGSDIKIKETPSDSGIDLHTLNEKYKNFDVLIINTDHIGHDLSGKAETVAKNNGILVVRSDSNFLNYLERKLLDYFLI
jgi:hypothetical protein